jgi:hypothetical protein
MLPDLLIDTLDFKSSIDQVILQGKDTALEFVKNMATRTSSILYILPNINERNIYFINTKDNTQKNIIFISYNVTILEQAYNLKKRWIKDGYLVLETIREKYLDVKVRRVNIITNNLNKMDYEKEMIYDLNINNINIFNSINYNESDLKTVISYLPKRYQPIAKAISESPIQDGWYEYRPSKEDLNNVTNMIRLNLLISNTRSGLYKLNISIYTVLLQMIST